MSASAQTRGRSSRRSARVNAVACDCLPDRRLVFALGAALAQAGVDPTACATIYLVGGAFFSAGGYASVLQVVNAPGADGAPPARWRWWSREPRRLQWLSAVVLLAGTIVFAINLADSLLAELSPAAANRLIWSPDMVGCALFLVSGHLAMTGIAGHFWAVWRRRDLGWWIIAVNQLGSVLFMVSAVDSFVSPSSGDELSTGVANWGPCSALSASRSPA